jgi:CO/xanthine dehydrogenase Mo-binding subunit/aerobic-type carbon monoxide dehydrogenase small subunit (CoxS/CutS family)
MSQLTLHVNGNLAPVDVDPETPLLYVLRNDLGLSGPKYGCGEEQCGACKVLVDGAAVPSCKLPVSQVQNAEITTVEGLGSADAMHPLQEAFVEEGAIQCGYCAAGMIIAAQGLLNQTRYPTDDEIRAALDSNLCRCGVYDRVRRAIKLRIGRPVWEPIYEVVAAPPLSQPLPDQQNLSPALQETPDLDAWIRIEDRDTITIFSGKAEIGQGMRTALAQLAAEELDVDLARIRVIMADTELTPDEGTTAGSMSLQMSGNAIRQAAAEARHYLLTLAHEELEAGGDPTALTVIDGVITDPATGRSTDYWSLFGGQAFGRQVTGAVQPKPFATHKLVGQRAIRIDLPAKTTGAPSYVHDMALPGMVHGRIVRPPNYGARLVAVDEEAVAAMPGVLKIVRDGSFLGVIAEREEQAIAACEALFVAATWETEQPLPTDKSIYEILFAGPTQDKLIIDGSITDESIPEIDPSPTGATHTLSADYFRPYQMHGSMGPSAAVAQWSDDKLTVWSHTQGAYPLRSALAPVMGLPLDQIHVIHTEGAGCYGHNGADDVALDAALLAVALPGRPVSLKWMRADEHTWEPYGPAMAVQLNASLDEGGKVVAWNQDIWSYPHSGRPRTGSTDSSGLLAAWHMADPIPAPPRRMMGGRHSGSFRNSDPLYAFPERRVVVHENPVSPLRTSSMRSLGAYANVFAIESFMDELAHVAGLDPVEFRLRQLTDERAQAVIRAAAAKAGWQPRRIPNQSGKGRGIAFAQYKNLQCYCAIVVDVTVDQSSGEIHIDKAVIAGEAGQVVNPDGLSNQLEGGFVQAASWTLHEAVQFDGNGITSRDWDTYPILRFTEAPVIETVLLNRPELPFLGAGEASQNPAPAAIANAVYDAVGVRLRERSTPWTGNVTSATDLIRNNSFVRWSIFV